MTEAHRRIAVPSAWFAFALTQQFVLWLVLPGFRLSLGSAQGMVGVAMLGGGAAFLAYVTRTERAAQDAGRKWTRSPAYLAMLTCLVGSALWLGTLSAVLPIAGFVSVVSSQFAVLDEQALLQRTGRLAASR